MEEDGEKLVYQYATNYRAYRRVMITTRALATVIAAGCALGFIALSWVLAIIVSTMLLFAGAITIIASLHNERTLILFNTRLVIINKDKRVYVSYDDVVNVSYKVPFYERDLMTGTVTVTAKTVRGITKKYKVRHLFNAADGVKFVREQVETKRVKSGSGNETRA